jgi:hypothetical protein
MFGGAVATLAAAAHAQEIDWQKVDGRLRPKTCGVG